MRLILILLTALSFPAFAQVYKWTDDNGVTHFGHQPPAGQREEVRIRDNRVGPASAQIPQESQPQERHGGRAPQLQELERAAVHRACALAKSELASAERRLTLALSIDQSSPMVEYRNNQVDLWKRRVRIECIGIE